MREVLLTMLILLVVALTEGASYGLAKAVRQMITDPAEVAKALTASDIWLELLHLLNLLRSFLSPESTTSFVGLLSSE